MNPRPTLSIIVCNWNGEDYLSRCLSSLLISARHLGEPFELIVIDDASEDKSVRIIRESFPAVRLIRNRTNLGFARSTNRAMAAAKGRYAILCNNDLAARERFVAALSAPFLSPTDRQKKLLGKRRLFAVSARTISWYDGRPNQLCMAAVWQGGRITPAWSDPPTTEECLFVQAGAACYDLELWRKFGGLSLLYEPGYWEDYDLSWRAAKAGLVQLYEPSALALHHGGGSMTRRYGEDGVAAMKARNHLIFEAANLSDPILLSKWIVRFPLASFSGHREVFWKAACASVPRLRGIIQQRLRLGRQVSDRKLLQRFDHFSPSW